MTPQIPNCPACGTPMRVLLPDAPLVEWVCPIAEEAQRRGLLPARVHQIVQTYRAAAREVRE